MSNSNYSIGLQRLKPVHTACCGLHSLAENRSWARDVNDRDDTETLTIFLETRPRRDVGTSRDRGVETETTTLSYWLHNWRPTLPITFSGSHVVYQSLIVSSIWMVLGGETVNLYVCAFDGLILIQDVNLRTRQWVNESAAQHRFKVRLKTD